MRPHRNRVALVSAAVVLTAGVSAPASLAASRHPGRGKGKGRVTSTAPGGGRFDSGQLQAQTAGRPGCGTNNAAEPSIHVSKANLVVLGSENGLGAGSQAWRGPGQVGGPGAAACSMVYAGQPNAIVPGVGASGGDIDVAIGSAPTPTGPYRIYAASLNLGSVNVATSADDGKTWSQTPVQGGIPVDDREWIAAYGADTSLLTYHDVATNNIDVLRSDNGGQFYTQVSRAIPDSDYKANANQHGNLVIDHVNTAGATPGQFWAYQSFVAPRNANTTPYDEAFLAVSKDGGTTWTDKPIPCTTAFGSSGLDHNFPNVSVAPNGTLFYAVSNDKAVYVAMSTNHGDSWTCSGPVSSNSKAIFPWLVATSAGEDLVYYGAQGTGSNQTWYVYFAQNLTQDVKGWSVTQLIPVHKGAVCESGVTCNGNRQLLDDFGVDTDQSGWAHIAYSHDAPDLGGSSSYTGYAVQTGGNQIGYPN